jgi:hypothetical protein
MTNIEHNNIEYKTRIFRGQSEKVGGLSHSKKQAAITKAKDKQFLLVSALIGTIDFSIKRSLSQRETRRNKRK